MGGFKRAGMAGTPHILTDHRQEADSRQEVGLDFKTTRPSHSDPPPQMKPQPTKVLQSHKTAPPSGDQAFKHMSYLETVCVRFTAFASLYHLLFSFIHLDFRLYQSAAAV